MDEAVAFIRAFIEKEYEAFVSSFEERDEEAYLDKRSVVNKLFAGDLVTEVNRPPAPGEDWFSNAPQHIAGIQPRILFQVKQYQHPELGDVYRCYVSSHLRPANSYFASFYVAQKKRGLRIVSRYHIDGAHETWIWRGGERFDTLSAPIAVRKFQEPSHPADVADYQAK